MHFVELIAKKRDRLELTDAEIGFFVEGITDGSIPDYQVAAFLMAVRINGLSPRETAALTLAMMRSGEVADFSSLGVPVCDKHSTGGVGDSVTLVALPIAAACGAKVAKMSGRGLGHTGGTIDKLESIGVDTAFGPNRMMDLVREVGFCVAQQSDHLAPADKVLYALRDVTATVDSIPLIASSILSKKFATGADAIVLDIKSGSGALMGDPKDAFQLASAMEEIAALAGRRAVSVITDMSQPLGRYIGNRIEVYEAVRVLMNQAGGRLLAVALAIASQMIALPLGISLEQARNRASRALLSGEALGCLRQMVVAQGGDVTAIDTPETLLRAPTLAVQAAASGYLTAIRADEIGHAAQVLGAGRLTKADPIDPDVGVVMQVSVGDPVQAGQPLATLYYHDDERARQAARRILEAIAIGPRQPALPPLIIHQEEKR